MPTGIYKRSKETIEKMRLRMMGNKINLHRIPWNKGKKNAQVCSEETRKKLSEYHKAHPIAFWKGKHFSKEHLDKIIKNIPRGKAHRWWMGGIAKDKRTGARYIQFRKQIFDRDNYTCRVCGKHGVSLHVHHIKSYAHFPELRYDESNATTLCLDCHALTPNYTWKGATFTV